MTGFNSKREAAADKLQEPVNLLEARRIAAEYGTPDSQVDDGNLYFALSKCLEHIDAQPAQEPSITRPCRSCNGTGNRDTGIPESPIATCKPCNGTGQIALAQPAQEPVAWAVQGCSKMWRGEFAEIDAKAEAKRIGGTCVAYALHAAPPQRPWVGLTDEEVNALWMTGEANISEEAHSVTAYEVEAKLKEKNT